MSFYAEIYTNVPGMKTFHTQHWSLPRCENSFLLQSSAVSLVNKCTRVFPGATMTDFTTVVEDRQYCLQTVGGPREQNFKSILT